MNLSLIFNKTDFLKTMFHSKNYLFARLMQIILNFVSIFFFTRIMNKTDFGIFAVFMSYLGLFTIIFSLNLSSAIQRFSYEKHSECDFEEFMSSFFVVILLVFIVLTPILLVNKLQIISLMNLPNSLLILIIVSTFLNILFVAYSQYLIPRQKSSEFMVLDIIKQVFFLLFSVVLIFLFTKNLYLGRIYGWLLINFIIGVYIVWKFKYVFKYKPNLLHVKYMLSYSLPLLVSSLASIILAHFDKIMINSLVDSASAGIYSIGYNIGAMLIPVVASVQNGLSPTFFKMMDEHKFKRLYNLMKKSFSVVLIAALFLLFFSKEITLIFVDSAFVESINIIPIVIFACIFYSLVYFYGSYLIYFKNTIVSSIIVLISGVSNIMLNLIYIPKFGYIAAAYTTLFSYAFMFFLTWFFLRIKKKNICPLQKFLFPLLEILSLFLLWKVFVNLVSIHGTFTLIMLRTILFIFGIYILFLKEINNLLKKVINSNLFESI